MTIKDSWLVNQFIAHRGFHDAKNPENTLGAFQRAVDHNYAIELDVRILADGTLVVHHDEKIARTTGADGYLKNMTWEEIAPLKVLGSEFGIPKVQQVLDLVDGRVPILFDIKNFSRKQVGTLESNLCGMLENYKGSFAVEAFNPFVLLWFKENHPEIKRGIISSSFKDKDNSEVKVSSLVAYFLRRLKFNKKIQPHFVSYEWTDLTNRFVRKCRLPILAWTLTSQEDYMKIVKYADNIIFENFEPKI